MRFWLVALLVAGTADAEPRRIAVETPVEAYRPKAHAVSRYLFLNRCSGGCSITGTTINDASMHMTTIPPAGMYTVQEFVNTNGDSGMLADAEWAEIVRCVQEVYSPYNITVSDQPPPAGTTFTEAIVAGKPQNIGLGPDILGIAPLANDCSPQHNVMSFSFANHHGPDRRIDNICWTASQESAHAFGLDHQFEFSDGTSACNDPTTYRNDCGGQKFFRNKRAVCGEMKARECKCNSSQNSHQQLLGIFGPGEILTPAPTASIAAPTNNSTVSTGFVAQVLAGSERGVAKVELFLNGSRWMVLKGAGFGPNGQNNPSTYTFYTPQTVPNGIIDVEAKAFDDLGLGVGSVPIRVMKGAPCAGDDACLEQQTCVEGKCMFAAPAGELGDECTYDQFCKSWTCLGDDTKLCTQECLTDEPTSCPSDFECLRTGPTGTAGYCWPIDTGCCSVGHTRGALWMHASLALLVVGWLRRRRR